MFKGFRKIILSIIFLLGLISLQFILADDSYQVTVSVTNGLPQILDVNICESDTCTKYIEEGIILPGESTFVIQVKGYDPNGVMDINWDATIIHIFNEGFALDTNDDFDGNLDYRKYSSVDGYLIQDGEGCVSSSDTTSEINCFTFNDEIFSYGFMPGGVSIYIQLFDNSGEDATYLLEYVDDFNGIEITQSLGLALTIDDVTGLTYSGAPGDINVPFYNSDNDSNYFEVINESNVNIDLNLSHTDLINDENNDLIIDKMYIHGDSTDINFGDGYIALPVNLERGSGMSLKTYLDIPVGTTSGAYAGTFGIAAEAH
jgi:hypothetical protein